jgi:RNA polymerase sigma-70 factor (ECF subfamily)
MQRRDPLKNAPLKDWFCREVLPLEPALTRYIRRNWRNESDVAELRQEIYARAYEAAQAQPPTNTKAYLFTIARNHLINSARRAQIVSFDLVADLESSAVMVDEATPDRLFTARDELRRVQAGLDRLPPRCREVIVLRRVEGLSQKEVAEQLGISVSTVEQQLTKGMRALVDFMLGGSGKVRHGPARDRKLAEPS